MKVSILISVHNGEKTLDKTFESLLSQTFQDFCIVAVNDASRDSSLQKLSRWQGKFGSERFFILDNENNLGLTHSLNRGLQKITTPYTARIDSDDWWEPQKLEKQVHFLEENREYGLVGTDYTNHFTKASQAIILPKTDALIKKSIFKRNPFAHSAVIYRTDLVKSIGCYDESIRYGQDYDLWLRLMPLTKFANLPGFLCHRNAVDTVSSRKQKEQMLQCVHTQVKYLKKYRYSLFYYRFLVEPLIVAFVPEWVKKLKRSISL